MEYLQLNGVMKMNDVIEDIKKEIKEKTVVVATSGGPDSMCLLNLLKQNTNLNIICAHVNHKLREESEIEAKMVKNYCKSNNITYEYYEIKNYKGNTENYAREKRYKFFEKILKKYSSKYLLTAHHGDDLIETILMKIIRGNINNLEGFKKLTKRDNYYIYRPLITKTKEDILNYCKNNNIKYAIDKTNFEDTYTRNRIRKYILPELKKENKNIHKNFIKLSNKIQEYENYINIEVEKQTKEIYKDYIDIKKLNKKEELIKEKIIYKILKKEYKENIKLIKQKHINSIINALNNKKPNITINLPQNKIFIKEYNNAKIKNKKEKKEYNFILKDEITIPNNHTIKVIKDIEETSNYVIKLNKKEISMPLHIRTKKEGDKIKLKGLNGRKKIKDIFIDEKIPKEERNNYPILTDDKDNILWLPGLKKSEFDKSKTKNYDIIIKYF